jgi:hypothetical protein
VQEASFTDALGYTSAAPRPDSGVLLNGVVAEVTFLVAKPPSQQAANGTGLYSLTTDAWVMRPTEQPNNFDAAQIQVRAVYDCPLVMQTGRDCLSPLSHIPAAVLGPAAAPPPPYECRPLRPFNLQGQG